MQDCGRDACEKICKYVVKHNMAIFYECVYVYISNNILKYKVIKFQIKNRK